MGVQQGPYPLSVHWEPKPLSINKKRPKPLLSLAATHTMDWISDLFAFRGRCQGSGCESPPPARGRQQGQDNFLYTVDFSLNWGTGGASDRGAPTCTIQWDLPRGTSSGGDEEPRGGGLFALGRGSGAGQLVATAHTQQGETADRTTPPGLHGIGDPPPIQGGVDYIPGATPAERATSAAYSGMAAAIAKWGTGTQESKNCKLAWQKAVDMDTSKIKLFQETGGGLQELKTYLFIKKGSVYCTVLHSSMKFMAISKATQHLQSQYGFVGDRTVTQEPTPILLPLLKTWQ
jgi:hypothetical protein